MIIESQSPAPGGICTSLSTCRAHLSHCKRTVRPLPPLAPLPRGQRGPTHTSPLCCESPAMRAVARGEAGAAVEQLLGHSLAPWGGGVGGWRAPPGWSLGVWPASLLVCGGFLHWLPAPPSLTTPLSPASPLPPPRLPPAGTPPPSRRARTSGSSRSFASRCAVSRVESALIEKKLVPFRSMITRR